MEITMKKTLILLTIITSLSAQQAAIAGNNAVSTLNNTDQQEPRAQRTPNKRRFLGACKSGDFDMVARCVAHGIPVDTANDKGDTGLVIATHNDHEAIVSFLLEEEADVNQKTSDGGTALQIASLGNYADIAQLLIDHDANLEATIGDNTALWIAAVRGHLNTVKLLIGAGASTHHKHSTGLSIIKVVKALNHFECAYALTPQYANMLYVFAWPTYLMKQLAKHNLPENEQIVKALRKRIANLGMRKNNVDNTAAIDEGYRYLAQIRRNLSNNPERQIEAIQHLIRRSDIVGPSKQVMGHITELLDAPSIASLVTALPKDTSNRGSLKVLP